MNNEPQDRVMTAKELLDMEAEKCVELVNKIQDVLEGENLDIAIIVLLRLGIAACRSKDMSVEEVLSQLLYFVKDTFEVEFEIREMNKEKMQ